MISLNKNAFKRLYQSLCLILTCALLSASSSLPDSPQLISNDSFSASEGAALLPHRSHIGSTTETPRRAYATSTESNEILVVNLESGDMEKAFSLDFPAKILAFSPDGKKVFLADYSTGRMVKLDLASREIEGLNGPDAIPSRLIIGSNGQGYATYEGSKEVVCLDFKKGSFKTLASFEKNPQGIALVTSKNQLFVSFSNSCDIASVDTSTLAITPFTTLDYCPDDLDISCDGKTLYLVKNGGEQIEVIDLATKISCAIASGSKELFSAGYSAAFIPNSKEGSFYHAKEQGTEIVDIHPKSQMPNTIVQLSKPISSIVIFPEPLLEASFRVNEPIAGEPVLFDASETKSQSEGRINYEWDFGDGQLAFSEEPLIAHTYEASGNYVAKLTATQQIEQLQQKLQGISPREENSDTLKTLMATTKENLLVAANDNDLNANPCTIATITTMQTPSPSSSSYGESVLLSATVDQSLATGNVSFYYNGSNFIGNGALSSGSASFSVNDLPPDTYSLSATYNGDSTYCTSTSTNSVSLTVSQTTPTITLMSNLNPSNYGNNVTFICTLTNPNSFGFPTGTVTFKDGSITLGTGSLSQASSTSSTAMFSISSLGAGSASPHSITAVYGGDSNFSNVTSSPLSQSVNQTAPTITLISNLNPSNYGNNVTFTCTLTNPNSFGFPTGTVTFKDGSTTLGTGTLTQASTTSSTATFSISSLGAGSASPHSITAVYGGDSNFSGVTSSPLSQTVNQTTPTIALGSALNPSIYGNTVTFTCILTNPNSFGFPTGTVTFIDNGTTILGTGTLSQNTSTSSKATFSLNSLGAGPLSPHSITAMYGGDSNFIGVTSSPALSQAVNKTTTKTTILSLSQSPTEYGQPITLEAIVVGLPATPALSPSGTVSFFADGGTLLFTTSSLSPLTGTNTISTGPVVYTPPPFLSYGPHTLYAVYNGDGNYLASPNSTTVPQQIVSTETTAVTTFADQCSNTSNSVVKLTATVTSVSPGSGIPTGTVQFYDGFALLGADTVDSSGIATVTEPLSLGNHQITSIYIPDNSNYTGFTAPTIAVTVTKDNTTTTLTSSNSSSTFGASVTFTAKVGPNCTGNMNTPTGTVTLLNNGSTVIGTATLSGGIALFKICNLYPNSYNLTAQYSGDGNYHGSTSSPSLPQTVTGTLGTTTTIISSSENPVAVCPDTTVLTATVTANTTCPDLVVKEGTVTFFDGSTPIGSANVINGIASATIDCFTSPGQYKLTATYVDAAGNFLTSSFSNFSQCVTPYDTELTLTLRPTQTDDEDSVVTATISVIPPNPPPSSYPDFSTSGTVKFYDGSDLISTIAVPPNSNTTFSVSMDPSCFGCQTVTAVYSGDPCPTPANFDTSSDTISTYLIAPVGSTVTLAMSGSPYYFCQPVTFMSKVSGTCPHGGCIPTGTVTFFDGTTEIGIAALDPEGIATLQVSTLSLGAHTISVTYNSDSFFGFSESSIPVTLTIVLAPTTTTLTVLPLSGSVYGQELILGAQVTSPAGVPTSGSVIFSDEEGTLATVQLDATGKASYVTTQIGAGTHNFTATYNPDCCSEADACFQGSSDSIKGYVITPILPDLTLTGSPTTVTYGDVINLTATVTSFSIGTPTGTVSFYLGNPSPATLLGTASLVNDVATLQVSNYLSHMNIPVGNPVTFNAIYSGDSNFLMADFPHCFEIINKAPVFVTLYSESPNPSFNGTAVNLTATVESLLSIPTDFGNSPVGIPPTGTVQFVIDGTTHAATLVNGIATFSISTLTVGSSHTILAIYSGDSNFLSNNSVTYTQQVEKIDTQTTVSSSSNPSTYNTSPTFTVTVASLITGHGTPTGNVTATYGSNSVTNSLSGGIGTFTIPNLQGGIDTILFQYGGDSNFNLSSVNYSQSVNAAATSTVASSSVNPSVFGQSVTLKATVSSTVVGTLLGTVTFFEGTTEIGSSAVSSGSASITLDNLTVGTHLIMMAYSGGGNFAPSTTASAFSQAVKKADTTTTLSSSFSTPFSYGEAVTYTANVIPTSPGAGIPTGSVSFYDNVSTLLGTVNLGIGGIATFTPSATTLIAGVHSITAVYSSDSNFNPSTSTPAVSQTVNPAATVTIVYTPSALNPSPLTGPGSIDVTVNAVDTGLVVPDGTVQAFYAGSAISSPVAVTNGVITVPVTLPPGAGDFPIVVTYTPGASPQNFSTSSGALDQLVDRANTTMTLTSSVNPSMVGQSVTFTATVTPSAATGTVSFFDGASLIAVQSMTSGVATFTTSSLTVGSHPITAVYSGDGSYASVTASLTGTPQVVKQAMTTTGLTSSIGSPEVGQDTILTATVTANSPASGTPTGTVTFSGSGMTTITVPLVNGFAMTGSIAFSSAGSTTLTATYNGDSNFVGSSGILPLVVAPAATTTVLTSSINPSQVGEGTILTATVSAQAPGAGTPTGTVTFSGSGTGLPVTVNLVNGVASTGLISFSPVGNYTLTAKYNSDGNFLTSSETLTQNVVPVDTQTTVSSSSNPSTYNTSPTFTVTVASLIPGQGTPTGNVIATYGSNSTTTSLSGGIATFTIPNLQAGIDTVLFQYLADGNYNPSSAVYSQTVNPAATTTTAGSSVNPSLFGQPVTLTATVTSAVAGTLTGTVSFLEGSTEIGSSAVSSGSASITLNNLSVGTHLITMAYSGGGNFAPSTTASAFSQAVKKADTTTTLASSFSTPFSYGEAVTYTANVIPTSPGAGIPTGSVSFYDNVSTLLGTVNLGIGGIASFTPSATTLIAGVHSITAVYSSDSNFNPSTSTPAVSQTVNPAATVTIVYTPSALNPSPLTGPGSIDVTVNAVDTGLVVPDGTVQAFYAGSAISSPVAVTNGVITVPVTLPPGAGDFPIVVTYTPGASPQNFSTSSGALDQLVDRANTTMTLTSSVNPSMVGQSVTFTATVTPSAATGTVSFFDGASLIAVQSMTSGVATFTTSSLTVGSHPITAVYSGDGSYASVTASLTGTPQVVKQAMTTTGLTSSIGSPEVGQDTILTATVTANSPASGTPTGTVTFSGSGMTTITVPLVNGVAMTGSIAFSSAGSTTLTATYNGDSNFVGSSGILPLVVAPAATTTVLTSSINPSQVGEGTILTATVSAQAPGAGTPTGTVTFSGSGTGLPVTVNLVNGVASTGLSSFSPVGNYTLTAKYNSDGNFLTSLGTLTQTVVPAETTTTLTSNIHPSHYGQNITLQATVTQSTGTVPLTGTVNFFEGSNLLGSGTITGGHATTDISTLSVGIHLLTAVYGGDNNYSSSISAVFTQVVDRGGSATTLVSSLNPSNYGESVTFTATVEGVSPASGTPTGNVNFLENGMVIGIGILSGSSPFTATITLSGLTVGTHQITAEYAGDGNFSPSDSSQLNQVVRQAPTVTSIVLNTPDPSMYGEQVIFVAAVTPDPAIAATVKDPTGTISFYDGAILPGNLLGIVSVDGSAIFETNLLSLTPITPHNILAVYSGDTNFLPSTSLPVQQSVTLTSQTNTTVTTLTSTPNPSDYGCSVTFNVAVAPNFTPVPFPGMPTGVVTLYYGTQPLTPLGLTLVNGMASVTIPNNSIPTLPAGSIDIVAFYSGDSNYSSSTAILNQVVNPIPAIMGLTTSGSPSVYAQPVTFTATLTATIDCPPSMSLVPTGTVSFYDGVISAFSADMLHGTSADLLLGATLLGTNPLDVIGVSTLTTDLLATGQHTITAVYNPDPNSPNFESIIATVVQEVVCIQTLTEMLSLQNPSTFGEAITLIASVSIDPSQDVGSDSGPPIGSVNFYDTFNGAGPTLIGTVPLSNGFAYLNISSLAIGTHSITASYLGSANFCTSQLATGLQQVVLVPVLPTNTALVSSPNSSEYGENLVFTATVTNPTLQGIPTGTVTFYDGEMAIGESILINGVAQLSKSTLTVGNHPISAIYSGDAYYTSSTSSRVAQGVNCLKTKTVMLTASPNPSVEGDAVTFIIGVSVSPSSGNSSENGPPIGSVTFYDSINGASPKAIGTVPLSNGLAILNLSTLSLGQHFITASFSSGSINFCSSQLAAPGYNQVVVVPVLSTNTVVSSSLNPAEFGNNVVFTAKVTDPSNRGIPTGTVTFYDGDTAIGTSILVNGVGQISDSTLSIGSHSITAIYSGNGAYSPATSSVFTEVIVASTYPLSPHDFYGSQVINKFLNYNEIVNILTWKPPQNDRTIVRYEIYRNAALTDLAGKVKSKGPYRFEDGNRKKKRTYTYYIVSVNADGKKSPPVMTKVIPHDKKKR